MSAERHHCAPVAPGPVHACTIWSPQTPG